MKRALKVATLSARRTDTYYEHHMSTHSIRDWVSAILPLSLVLGSLTIAVIDPNYRQPFMDLSKIFLGGLVGLMIPSDRVGLRRRIH